MKNESKTYGILDCEGQSLGFSTRIQHEQLTMTKNTKIGG